jgi:hypothetical protein
MAEADALFGHGLFTWMFQMNVLVLLLDPGSMERPASRDYMVLHPRKL